MSSLAEIEAAADALPAEQKQELLLFLAAQLRQKMPAQDLPSPLTEIQKTPDVSGGAECVRNTRIPVWTLVQLKKLGRGEIELLSGFPSLTQADLDAVWNYYRGHPVEIDDAIDAEEAILAIN